MSDRELLELAAKAAGYPVLLRQKETNCGVIIDCAMHYLDVIDVERLHWNPLTDDGDALRLAVKCELDVLPFGAWDGEEPDKPAALVIDAEGRDTYEAHKDDAVAATRRCIVRAAAQIGRAMP